MKWFVVLTLVVSFLLLLTMPVSVIETSNRPVTAQTGAQIVAATSTDAFEADFLDTLNQYRISQGLNTVSFSQALSSITAKRSADMVENQYYAHAHPVTGADFSAFLPAGSGFACENLLLSGTTDAKTVLREWMASKSHAKCLLQPKVQFASIKQAAFIETDEGVQYLYTFITSTR
jgi:uncharacterized protein YkwD